MTDLRTALAEALSFQSSGRSPTIQDYGRWRRALEQQDAPREYQPWIPMSDPIDVKVTGKLIEEGGEVVSAAARCLIQGIDGTEPTSGKSNRLWLSEEIADARANFELAEERFDLDLEFIHRRKEEKKARLRTWHAMAGGPEYTEPMMVMPVELSEAGYYDLGHLLGAQSPEQCSRVDRFWKAVQALGKRL